MKTLLFILLFIPTILPSQCLPAQPAQVGQTVLVQWRPTAPTCDHWKCPGTHYRGSVYYQNLPQGVSIQTAGAIQPVTVALVNASCDTIISWQCGPSPNLDQRSVPGPGPWFVLIGSERPQPVTVTVTPAAGGRLPENMPARPCKEIVNVVKSVLG